MGFCGGGREGGGSRGAPPLPPFSQFTREEEEEEEEEGRGRRRIGARGGRLKYDMVSVGKRDERTEEQ